MTGTHRYLLRAATAPLAATFLFLSALVHAAPPPEAPEAADVAGNPAPAIAADAAALIKKPDRPADIMHVKDVRIGMKGYGLTVFAGTKIEAFPVEVITVVKSATPGHAVVWMQSDLPKLRNSGPVHGMSGSPIYLWQPGEEHILGKGGKLLGAFAFGFSGTVDTCLVGIQPIEYMLQEADRTTPPVNAAKAGGATSGASGTSGGGQMTQLLMQMEAIGQDPAVQPGSRVMLRAIEKMANFKPADAPAKLPVSEQARPLMLSMSVPASLQYPWLKTMFQPYGITPVASDLGVLASQPPDEIYPDATMIEPGSVMTIPLAFGDLDLSGSGTVTYVTPDGTVLGFGHAMNATGAASMPFANGYVQFFVPSRDSSFKQAGSLKIVGTILRDENVGVSGQAGQYFTSAPVQVDVMTPAQPRKQFNYQVVHQQGMTPQIAATVVAASMTWAQDLPLENTIYADITMNFPGGRTLKYKSVSSPGDPRDLVMKIAPVIGFMKNNPFEELDLESMSVTLRVEPQLKAMEMTRVWLATPEVAPGETVKVFAQFQPTDAPEVTMQMELKVPEQTPEGDYPLFVGGADVYAAVLAQSSPELFDISSVDDAVATLNKIGSLPETAVYATLAIPNQGLAVGRSRLNDLPSSRAAMLLTPSTQSVAPVATLVNVRQKTERVVQGQAQLVVNVRKPYRGVTATEDE